MITIIKRNGRGSEPFSLDKIVKAVSFAQSRTNSVDTHLPLLVAAIVEADLIEENITETTVDDIHKLVENTLMDKDKDTAREYITYRKSHMPDIFRPRQQYRPFEYPHLHKYVDAIRQSYWTHDEFDFTSDIQDFHVNLTGAEKEAVRRTMLAISHIEVTVKMFWTKLSDRLPKPEIAEVGVTMGESEVRHANAYAELLNVLGLNDAFSEVAKVPAIAARQAYMDNAIAGKSGSDKDYMESILLFSLFIENVSLFSQFLIVMMINQDKSTLKGISNVIASTALEENLHAKLGADIVKVLRVEHPEWFNHSLDLRVNELVHQSYQAEQQIIDWIFELGEIGSVSKYQLNEYIKSRYNLGLSEAGFTPVFDVDAEAIKPTEFFDLQVNTTTHVDFFHKRSSNYTKKAQSFDSDSLF